MPTIAVVVPNRNDSRFLLRCLDSVLNQRVPPDELIVVDDQSTDDSVELVRRRLDEVAGARLLVNPVNLGTAGAVSAGLHQTRCDYVLSLAANDLVLPGIFAHAKSCLARSPGLGLWSAMAYFVDEADQVLRLHASAVISQRERHFSAEQCVRMAYTIGNWFTGPTMIFHREAFLEAGGFDTAYQGLSDWITALVLASRYGAAYTPEPLGATRIHRAGLLSRTLEDPASLEALLKLIRTRGPQEQPQLFSDALLDRFEMRVRFAAIRSEEGTNLTDFARKTSGLRGAVLTIVDRLISSRWKKIRVALSFLLLRPFDVLPSLWYRYACGAVVRVRLWRRAAN
jgi:cellulose synthase/poly-beta-1,6-N-acetylglucosamine synthase-like glycosyltransferase